MYAVFKYNTSIQLNQTYQATPNSWRFLRKESVGDIEGTLYGGVEDKQFNQQQLNELYSLQAVVFNDSQEFRKWLGEYGFISKRIV